MGSTTILFTLSFGRLNIGSVLSGCINIAPARTNATCAGVCPLRSISFSMTSSWSNLTLYGASIILFSISNFRSEAWPDKTILDDSPVSCVKVNCKSLSKYPESRLMPSGIGEYSSICVKSILLSLSSSIASRFPEKGRNLPLRAKGAPFTFALKYGSIQVFR